MSGADKAPAPPSRPTLFDFLLVVSGFALSLFLSRWPTLQVVPGPDTPEAAANYLVPILPQLVRLPEGVILLWPVFLITQRLLGRKQGLTWGEWLWVIAWLATVLLLGLVAWQTTSTVPEFVRDQLPRVFVLSYLFLLPALAAVALVLMLVGLAARWQRPWTHNFALVLLAWPALPVAGIVALAKIPWPAP
jgi:hypothetical protein